MPVFERSVSISTSAERLFDFHLDTKNLRYISPRWFKTKLVRDEGEAAERILDLRVSSFFLPSHWRVEVSEYNRPIVLSDLVTKGPFNYFHHRRTFVEQAQNGPTVMTDHIEYTLPLGVLGRVFDFLIMRRIISAMFTYRQRRTKELLEHAA
jgi:ligand-binding SRPBCC domain-containing protein